MKRIVVPEILDNLAHDDPEARRARIDLRRINGMMGNHRWFRRELGTFSGGAILELGSGSGDLLASLAQGHRRLVGLDFAPRPEELPEAIEWLSGDVFETIPAVSADQFEGAAVIANLFLHHFESDSLVALGELIQPAGLLCFSEPFRSLLSLAESAFIWPFVNRVTRHDMPVSIRAGFRSGELPKLLNLDPAEWKIREHTSFFGAYRLVASKKK